MKKYNNFSIKIPFVSIDGRVANADDTFIFRANGKSYEGKLVSVSYVGKKDGGNGGLLYMSPVWKVETCEGIVSIEFDFVGKNGEIVAVCPYIGMIGNDITIYANENDYYNKKTVGFGIERKDVKFSVALKRLDTIVYSCGLTCLEGVAYSIKNKTAELQYLYIHDFDIVYIEETKNYIAANMKFINEQSFPLNKITLFACSQDAEDFMWRTGAIKRLNGEKRKRGKQITITISETDDIKSVSEKILQELSKSN